MTSFSFDVILENNEFILHRFLFCGALQSPLVQYEVVPALIGRLTYSVHLGLRNRLPNQRNRIHTMWTRR